jgi:hypothetical protein
MENWKNMSSILNAYNDNKEEIETKLYQIYEHIEDDNKRGIVKILKSGININSEYEDSTPLMKCIDFDRYDIAKYFIDFCNANPNFRETKNEGALWYSLRNQKLDFLFLFLDAKPNLVRGNNNQIMLIEATKLSNVAIVQALLNNKRVKVNEKDGYGNTALHYVLAKNPMTPDDIEISRLLLAAGADQNSMNVVGETPGKTNEDSMANSVLFEYKLQKQIELADEKKLQEELAAQAQLESTNNLEAEIEYEEVMELDPITNTMKPVLRPKPKPRPLPKPVPNNRIRKKI